MLQAIDWILSNSIFILEVALGLTVIIFFHELGHFIFAKRAGCRVDCFSIGFGPKVWGFKKGETEYKICAIPLGGYVKIFGQGGVAENEEEKEDPRFFENKTVGQRFWVFVAGVLMNAVIAVVLSVGVFLLGREVPSNLVGYVKPGSPAFEAGLMPGDRIVSVVTSAAKNASEITDEDWKSGEVDNWQPISQKLMLRTDKENLWLKVDRPSAQSELEFSIPAKKINTPEIMKSVINTGLMPIDVYLTVMGYSSEDSPAKGKLEIGDIILAADGRKISNYTPLINILADCAVPSDEVFEPEYAAGPKPDTRPISLLIKRKNESGEYEEISIIDYKPKVSEYFDLGVELENKPVVGSVRKGSPASIAGLRAGFVITGIGVKGEKIAPVGNWSDIEKIFRTIASRSDRTPLVLSGHYQAAPENEESIEITKCGPGDTVIEALGFYFKKGLYIKSSIPDGTPFGDVMMGPSDYERPAVGDRIIKIGKIDIDKDHCTPLQLKRAMANLHPDNEKRDEKELVSVIYEKPDGTQKEVATRLVRNYVPMLGILSGQTDKEGSVFFLRHGLGASVEKGLWEPFKLIGLTVSLLASGKAGTGDVAGPIGIFQFAHQSAEKGLTHLFLFLAFISINLALLNILPIPVLDGGHILFLIIEKFRGSPLPEKIKTRFEFAGLVLLLGFVAFALKNDLVRIVTGTSF